MGNKVLIIAGMHRSGTSVVAQWLSRSGLFVGDTLLGPNTGNEQGHFEDADFLSLHEKFLRRRKLDTSGFTSETPHALTAPEKNELKEMLAVKNTEHEQWGWKEPRTCLFLNEYNQAVPQAFYVIVVRNFNDTVSSMITRQYKVNEKTIKTKRGLPKLKWLLFKRKSLDSIFETESEKFLKVWIHYYQEILQHTKILPANRFIVLSYRKLIRDDKNVFHKMKDQWQFSLNYLPFLDVFEMPLMSEVRDITKHVKDNELVKKAMTIEREILTKYAVIA